MGVCAFGGAVRLPGRPHTLLNLQNDFSASGLQADLAKSEKCSTTGGLAKYGPTMARQSWNAGEPRKSTVWFSTVSQKIMRM